MYDDNLDHHFVKKMTGHHSDRHSTKAFSAALLGDHAGSVPLGTKLLPSYHGRKVVVVVNDVGAGKVGQDRVLDLGHAAMEFPQGHPVTNSSAGPLTLDLIQIVASGTSVGPQ